MSALSINKQTFLRLHPDMEKEVLKFYRTKQAQREEIFTKLSQELLVQEESKDEAFFAKHGDVAPMVSRKTLRLFTERENRVSASRKLSTTAPRSVLSLQLVQSEPSNTSIQDNSTIGSASKYMSLNIPQLRFATEEAERLSSPIRTLSKFNSNTHETKYASINLQKIEERPSSKQQAISPALSPTRESFLGGTFTSDQSFTANLQYHLTGEQSFFRGHQSNFEMRSPNLKGENGAGTPTQKITSPIQRRSDNNIQIDRSKIEELLKIQQNAANTPKSAHQRRNPVQLVNSEVPTSPKSDAQRVSTPKSKVIRLKMPTLEDEAEHQSFRMTKNEELRNHYLENFKLHETADVSDIDNLRFEFNEIEELRKKKSISRLINTKKSNGILSATASQHNSPNKTKNSSPEQSRSPSRKDKVRVSKMLLDTEQIISQSTSPSFILSPQHIEPEKTRPIHSRPTFKQYFFDINSPKVANKSLNQSRKLKEASTTSSSNVSHNRRVSIIQFFSNMPNQGERSTVERPQSPKVNSQEQKPDAKTRILGAFLSHRNSFTKTLCQRGYGYYKALEKRRASSRNSMRMRDDSKNETIHK